MLGWFSTERVKRPQTPSAFPNRGSDLNRALVAFLGYGDKPCPGRFDSEVVRLFGRQRGAELNKQILAILSDAQAIPVDWSIHSIDSAKRFARIELKARHKDLDAFALDALVWSLPFEWL